MLMSDHQRGMLNRWRLIRITISEFSTSQKDVYNSHLPASWLDYRKEANGTDG